MLLGRPALNSGSIIGRLSAGIGNNSGRQSPLLLSVYSPVTKRLKVRPSPRNPSMRKSMSLDNVQISNEPSSSELTKTRQQFTPDKIEEKEDIANAEECAESSVSDAQGRISPAADNSKFTEVSPPGIGNRSASYHSLPRPVSRSKSITRSLVPKMRRMFEKSRSCDPDLDDDHQVPEAGGRYLSPPLLSRDGTESTRSSFVLLDPGAPSDPTLVGEIDSNTQERKSKGFMNKCVTKVKSFMGKAEERE